MQNPQGLGFQGAQRMTKEMTVQNKHITKYIRIPQSHLVLVTLPPHSMQHTLHWCSCILWSGWGYNWAVSSIFTPRIYSARLLDLMVVVKEVSEIC